MIKRHFVNLILLTFMFVLGATVRGRCAVFQALLTNNVSNLFTAGLAPVYRRKDCYEESLTYFVLSLRLSLIQQRD